MATTFVGRQAELAEAMRFLKRSRLVTLTGAGGVGKTRLARRVLDDAREIPVDLTVLVDLEPLDEPDALPYAVARSLGLEEDPVRPAVEAMAAWFRRRHVLLVLDTCDQVVDAVAGLAAGLLRAVPDLRILATSRQPLGVPGEHVYVVRPMRADDAVRLLRERIGAGEVTPAGAPRRADLAPFPDLSDAAAAELCGLLDGVPLAIELAARWLPGRSIRELIEGLRGDEEPPDPFDPLVGPGSPPPGDAPEGRADGSPAADPAAVPVGEVRRPRRHQSMRAAIGWSHGLCSPRERLLWARMSVFGVDFDLEAAEFVCAGGPLPATAVLDAIGGLVEKSVVDTRDHPDGVRYRVPHGVRRFGAEWLDRLGERDEVRRRHRDYAEWRNERGSR